MSQTASEILSAYNIKPTPNRLLVVNALIDAKSPKSLIDLETEIETIERSSVLRVLTLLLDNDIVHIMQDGYGVARYELCHGNGHCSLEDMHVHFFCEKCGKTICLEDIHIPCIDIPTNFDIHSANFMLKGLCPNCKD